eukprot:m.359865 g.359865  ORF g.359865 m.359865 type:complete len:299 (-) comp18781_c0_seq1:439-1335(-)
MEDVKEHFNSAVSKTNRFWVQYNMTEKVKLAARLFIAGYFLNVALTGFQIWYYYSQAFPTWQLPLLPASILFVTNRKLALYAGLVLLIYATADSASILWRQLRYYFATGVLYINELMVKKFSVVGATALMMSHHYNPKAEAPPLAGMLVLAAPSMGTKKSIVMLIGRLLLSSLFIFIGYKEVMRQLANTVQHDGHVHHRRPAGDGHDAMWYKLLEFGLSIPFSIGFKTTGVARLLALVLVIEACTAWSWWSSVLGPGYVIHAREHFTVNLAAAGGCLLLSFFGVGKYAVDELLKKKDT